MFEQLAGEWHSKISFRLAIINAVGWGFNSGGAFGMMILKAFFLNASKAELAGYLLYSLAAMAAAIRFYFLAVSRAREQTLNRA